MDNSGILYRMDDAEMKKFRKALEGQGKDRKLYEISEDQFEKLKPMTKSERKGYMRNQPCICGSGKKFKKCCW